MSRQTIDNGSINTHEKTIDVLGADIQIIRNKICYAILITFAIIAIPALAASIYRTGTIGWQPIIFAHIAIVSILWLIVLFRTRIPYKLQAGFIVLMFLIIGLGGIFQFGLIAGGTVFLVAASPITTLLFGGRAGTISLIVVLIGAASIGLLTVSGNMTPAFDIAAYAVAPSSWLTSISGWALASASLTASLHVFNKHLINTLIASRQQEQAVQLGEERLKMVIEGSEQGFWDWDITTNKVRRNDRWAQMLGYATIGEFEDNVDSWTNAIHPDDREAAWASINDHIEGRTSRHKREYRMLTKDGTYKWILDHAKIVQRDANGHPLRMSGTHTDITDQKQMQEEKETLITSLQQALDELKVLQGIIPICSYCHNIRDDRGLWNKIEEYISRYSEAEFSHGICPSCVSKVRADAGLKD